MHDFEKKLRIRMPLRSGATPGRPGRTAATSTMDGFEAAFWQWQDAEQAASKVRSEFSRVVYLYLVMAGPAPTVDSAGALAQASDAALQALVRAYAALRQRRCAIPLI